MPSPRRILHMTAFAAAPGGGNPAGVIPDAAGLDDAEMQRIATDLGYPESAFVVEPAIGGDRRHVRLRYFSPGAEVPFCGHATVAAAAWLAGELGPGGLTVETNVGTVVISTERTGSETTASFTSVEPESRDLDEVTAARLLDLLGLRETDLEPSLPLRESFAGNWHPILAVRERDAFDAFRFDPQELRELMNAQGWAGTVTVVHKLPDTAEGPVFEARNLFPVGAITEDPATGSAAASLGAYLRAVGAVLPPARLTIHQGRHVGRPSILRVDIPATRGITVTGTAAVVVDTAERTLSGRS